MRVFLTELNIDAATANRLIASLPSEQRHRANSLAATVAFCLLRYAAAQVSPTVSPNVWQTAAHGKPYLAGGPHFNLSHTRHGVAVAISTTQEVGVDLEEIRERPFKFTQRYFTPTEQKAVETATDRTDEIIRIWTAKEAAAKCSGTGIDRNFCNIPTNGVKNARVLLGNVPHWLSVTPAAEMPEIEWVCAEQLLPD